LRRTRAVNVVLEAKDLDASAGEAGKLGLALIDAWLAAHRLG
jgi:hypothetical protein